MESWTCEVCQIQMGILSRSPHLSGKRHAKTVQSRQQETNNSQNTQSEPRGYVTESTFSFTNSESPAANIFEASENTTDTTAFTTPAVILWECTLCGCYVESSTTREHLTSMEHVGKLLETIKITCQALEPLQVFPSDMQSQTYNHGLGIWETLDYQEAVHRIKTFGTYSSNPHLLNTEIPKSTNTSAVDPPKSPTASKNKRKSKTEPRFWTCPDCSTTIAIKRKSKHTCPNPHETVPPTTPKSSLDTFFLSFPGYAYDPSKPPAESFGALQRYLPRFHKDGSFPSTWDEYRKEVFTRYQTALTQEFNLWFGTEDDIQSWHSLCRAVGIRALPSTCAECRQAIRSIHVNIVDLIEWARKGETQREVKIFKSVKELSKYSYEEDKIYRKDQLEQGVVLRHLLREIAKENRRMYLG